MMVLPMAQGFLIKEFPEMKPIAIAPLHEITPHLGPVAEMSWMDDKGLHSRSISPFPGAGMLSPDLFTMAAPAGVGAAIALPAVNAARGKAREVVSVNNLRQISMAMMIHVQDHNVYPKDLGELLTRQIVDSAEVFISPRDDIDVPAGFDQWDNQKKAAWVNANSSYVIITLGQKPKGGVENIVGFEKFHPDKRQIPLVFEDGHVEQMSPAEARRRIEKQTGKTVEQLQGTKLIN